MSIKSIFSVLFLLVCFVATSTFAKDDEDAAAQAMRDLQMGMQGLKEASSNPALLAQLMRDLQDPQMMAEAKKMMDSPEFQKQMKKMTNDPAFKDSTKKTMDTFKDPTKAAQAEAKFEHMLKVGQEDMKKAAGSMMEEAMAAMSNPEVMSEMQRMIKDPNFQQQLAAMTKDPSFKTYVEAMQDMMNDPEKKRRLEKMSESVRAAL